MEGKKVFKLSALLSTLMEELMTNEKLRANVKRECGILFMGAFEKVLTNRGLLEKLMLNSEKLKDDEDFRRWAVKMGVDLETIDVEFEECDDEN